MSIFCVSHNIDHKMITAKKLVRNYFISYGIDLCLKVMGVNIVALCYIPTLNKIERLQNWH